MYMLLQQARAWLANFEYFKFEVEGVAKATLHPLYETLLYIDLYSSKYRV